MLSGKYSKQPQEEEGVDIDDVQPGIAPALFRSLVGRGHVEFSTSRQQVRPC